MGAGEGIEHITCALCGRAFRSIGWKHLVGVHGFDPEQPIREYAARFGVAHPWSEATREKSRRSQAARLERTGKRWTRERVIGAIQSWWRRHDSFDYDEILAGAGSLTQEARLKFGSWRAAVQASGLDPEAEGVRRRWTVTQVVEAIRAEHAAGRDLSESATNERFSALVNAGRRRLGSWSAALAAAGVASGGRTREWSEEAVLEEIRRLGEPKSAKEAEILSPGIVHAAFRYFGGWIAAVEAAGFTYPARRGKRRWLVQNPKPEREPTSLHGR